MEKITEEVLILTDNFQIIYLPIFQKLVLYCWIFFFLYIFYTYFFNTKNRNKKSNDKLIFNGENISENKREKDENSLAKIRNFDITYRRLSHFINIKSPVLKQKSFVVTRLNDAFLNSDLQLLGELCGSNIRKLDISDSLSITTLEEVSKNCPNLEYLNLSQCIGISDRDLRNVFYSFPFLEELILDGMFHISDKTMKLISKWCCCLRNLSLNGAASITNEGIIGFSNSVLEKIDISLCFGISYIGVAQLAMSPYIRKIHVFCNGISGKELDYLQKQFPGIISYCC